MKTSTIDTSAKVRRAQPLWLTCGLAVSLLLSQQAAFGQAKVSVVGSGAETGISFSFTTSVPLNTPGLTGQFGFDSCVVPAGETCSQLGFSGFSGVVRITTNSPGGLINRTFAIACYESNGTYVATGGSGFSAGTVTVTNSNPPLVTTSAGSSSFVKGSPPVVVDPNVTVIDPNTGPVQSAKVAMASPLTEDLLAFTNNNAATFGNITASYDIPSGTLTLTSSGGTATLTQWQAAMSAVTYADIAAMPNTAARTVTFVVLDTVGSSCTAVKGVTVSNPTPVQLQSLDVE